MLGRDAARAVVASAATRAKGKNKRKTPTQASRATFTFRHIGLKSPVGCAGTLQRRSCCSTLLCERARCTESGFNGLAIGQCLTGRGDHKECGQSPKEYWVALRVHRPRRNHYEDTSAEIRAGARRPVNESRRKEVWRYESGDQQASGRLRGPFWPAGTSLPDGSRGLFARTTSRLEVGKA